MHLCWLWRKLVRKRPNKSKSMMYLKIHWLDTLVRIFFKYLSRSKHSWVKFDLVWHTTRRDGSGQKVLIAILSNGAFSQKLEFSESVILSGIKVPYLSEKLSDCLNQMLVVSESWEHATFHYTKNSKLPHCTFCPKQWWCIDDVRLSWMNSNDDKTEYIIFGSNTCTEKLPETTISINIRSLW